MLSECKFNARGANTQSNGVTKHNKQQSRHANPPREGRQQGNEEYALNDGQPAAPEADLRQNTREGGSSSNFAGNDRMQGENNELQTANAQSECSRQNKKLASNQVPLNSNDGRGRK